MKKIAQIRIFISTPNFNWVFLFFLSSVDNPHFKKNQDPLSLHTSFLYPFWVYMVWSEMCTTTIFNALCGSTQDSRKPATHFCEDRPRRKIRRVLCCSRHETTPRSQRRASSQPTISSHWSFLPQALPDVKLLGRLGVLKSKNCGSDSVPFGMIF